MTTPTNDIERLLATLLERRDDDAWRAFLEALATTTLYFPRPDAPADEGQRMVGADERLSFAAVEHEGRTYVPAYTSVELLQAGATWAPGYVGMPGHAFVGMVADGVTRVAINYGAGDLAVVIDEHTIGMLTGSAPEPETGRHEQLANPEQVMFASPVEEPVALLDAAAAVAQGRPAIRALYRALVVIPPRPPQVMIAVEVAEDAVAHAEESAIGEAVVAAGEEAVVTVLEPLGKGPVETYFRTQSTPFWRRS